MTFEEYQKQARKTAVYPDADNDFIYPTFGLVSEAGEVADIVKKAIRDDGGEVLPEKRDAIKKELGDVLWYVAQVASEFGFSLDEVAAHNLEKLNSRKERGTLGGSGDDR